MAITQIGAAGTAASGTIGSTLSLTTSGQAVDASSNRFGLLLIAKDNSSTTDGDNSEITSVTGGTGTWTKLAEYTNGNGSAGAGVTVSLWLFEPSAGNAIGTVFTVNMASAIVDKCAQFLVFSKASGNLIQIATGTTVQTNAADAATDIGSASFASLASQERLYYRGFGKEANTITGVTASSGFTGLLTNRSRNNAAAVCVGGEYRIATSTGETSNPTLAVSGDYTAVFVALEEYSAGPVTHATTGALTGQIGSVAGSATHVAIHGTSGAFTGQLGSVAGSAARKRAMASSGALTGQIGSISGAAARAAAAVTHAASGILTA